MADLGIERIVRQAGHSRGAFHAHFASKADLLLRWRLDAPGVTHQFASFESS